jgi:hypothetical protein
VLLSPQSKFAKHCKGVLGHCIIAYDKEGPFMAKAHWVVGCSSPPIMLAVGLKVLIRGTQGELTGIHSVREDRVYFIFQLHDLFCAYVVLQVHP